MRRALCLLALLASMGLAACGDDDDAAKLPPAKEVTAEAIGRYCNMVVIEHPGPKAQILLKSSEQPVWFATVRDAVVFTLLPEEPKDIAAIYVNDMGKASWKSPEPGTWTEARSAWFVIESKMKSGMDTPETVPFADKGKAEGFAKENGGRVVAWADIPRDYVIEKPPEGAGASASAPKEGEPMSHEMGDHQ